MAVRSRTGFFRQEVNRTAWEVPERYRDLKQAGTGAYGTVCSAWDRRTGAQVAIKKLHRPFQSKLFAKRAYRELRLLKHMRHENVIGLLDVFTAEISLDRLRDFYLVMPFMGTDLGKLMKLERLSEDRVQFLVYQMMRGLKYIHSAGIIHRDLKPGNLAINPDCELKILDFGLARQADAEMTGYVVTRWYRAPEVILNWMHYTQTVDIWSAGCIMAEMLLGKPLFKGSDHLDQLREIMKITGTPSGDFVVKLQSQDAKNYIRSLPKVLKKDLHAVFSKASSSAVCVLEKMLLLDPERRVSASEALDLPFFGEFRDTEEETEALPYDQTMDNTDLPLDQWKRLPSVLSSDGEHPELDDDDNNAGPANISITGPDMMIPTKSHTYSCHAYCRPSCTYAWKTNHGPWIGGQGNVISITPQEMHSSKLIVCKATNSVSGLFVAATRNVTVISGPSEVQIEGPDTIEMVEKHKFVCTAKCLPSCRYVSSVDGQSLRGNVIEMTVEQPLQSVTLKCEAQNTASRKTATAFKTVQLKGSNPNRNPSVRPEETSAVLLLAFVISVTFTL
ncbi:hypothetical protein F2P81_018556 [Scophthalmus maximus]|uniref:mitogen-activated protein kinase n=1 Tax=Scophthalmus maximus TaxID=52904 RepID=A0A6A4SE88_SCOMX|nr:hypothetical protein F2P81_018556 [Scophthalmus maximus]